MKTKLLIEMKNESEWLLVRRPCTHRGLAAGVAFISGQFTEYAEARKAFDREKSAGLRTKVFEASRLNM